MLSENTCFCTQQRTDAAPLTRHRDAGPCLRQLFPALVWPRSTSARSWKEEHCSDTACARQPAAAQALRATLTSAHMMELTWAADKLSQEVRVHSLGRLAGQGLLDS